MKSTIIRNGIIVGVLLLSVVSSYAASSKSTSYIKGEKISNAIFRGENSIVSTINGEAITSREIAYAELQNDYLSSSLNIPKSTLYSENTIIDIAKRKLVIQKAREHGISVSEIQIREIEEKIENSIANNPEQNNYFICGLGLSVDEYVEFACQMQIDAKTEQMFFIWFTKSLLNGTLITNDSEFNGMVLNFKHETDKATDAISITQEEASNMIIDIYLKYIDVLFSEAEYSLVSQEQELSR